MGDETGRGPSRRVVLGGLGALAAAAVGVGRLMGGEMEANTKSGAVASGRMPTAFIPHGGGPWPIMEMGFDRAQTVALADYMRSISSVPAVKPRALLVISAHWEARVPTVMTGAAPPMYDYSGFARPTN
ncbi:MAG: hypothetical protein R3F43_31635 [bacterium]